MWPKQAGYAECAKNAAGLAVEYGRVLVTLRRAHDALDAAADPADPEVVKKVDDAIEAFQKVCAAKEALTPYPRKLETKVQEARGRHNIPTEGDQLADLRAGRVLTPMA